MNIKEELEKLIDDIRQETVKMQRLEKENINLKEESQHLKSLLGFWKSRAEELYREIQDIRRKI